MSDKAVNSEINANEKARWSSGVKVFIFNLKKEVKIEIQDWQVLISNLK